MPASTNCMSVQDTHVSQEGRFNPFVASFRADPYTVYRHYRSTTPVHWGCSSNPCASGAWYLFRYADVKAALKDRRLGREVDRVLAADEMHPVPDSGRVFADMYKRWMVFKDPPDHTRLRDLVQQAFTPKIIDSLQPRIQQITHELLDRVQSASSMDLIADFAFPLPVIVIAELLGVPPSDREQFKIWSTAISTANLLRQAADEKLYQQATQATASLVDYLGKIIEERRRHPKDDLISGLVAAVDQGSRLSYDEMVATCILLLTAGHETTVNLIGKGVLALLRNREQFEWLRKNPAHIPDAIEELLRYDSPVQIVTRYAMEDVEYGGKPIHSGDAIGLAIGAANRDPEVFDAPDRLDFKREAKQHLSFGLGIHFCLGAALARREGQIAIRALLDRMPQLSLQDVPLQWGESIVFHGLKALPVSF